MNSLRLALVSGVLTVSSGCLFQKAPKAVAPVVIPPAPVAIPAPSTVEPPPVVQQTPSQTIPGATLPPAETPAPKPSPFPPAGNPPTRSTAPPPARPAPSAPAAQVPALGAVIPADQRKKLDAEYVADLGQANQILGRLSGKTLTAEQLNSVNRARAFIKQAAQFHDRDLATAAELARRARVLTQDLASSLR